MRILVNYTENKVYSQEKLMLAKKICAAGAIRIYTLGQDFDDFSTKK
jgi:hypothetical protein